MRRRDALLAIGAIPVIAACGTKRKAKPMTSEKKMPVLFLAHGAPILLDDAAWMEELAAWARSLPKPKNILIVSAHWEDAPVTLGATEAVPLVYDFYGFPDRYYQTKYATPNSGGIASRVRDLLKSNGVAHTDNPRRGLDHGAYVPLVAMYPEASIPVLQISMPGLDPKKLVNLGKALAPLRDEGTLVVGSGFLTHNMHFAFKKGTPQWAREFDEWCKDALARQDVDALIDFRAKAPNAAMALPTWEHYAPVLVAAGAALTREPISFPISGFWMDGAFTRRSVQFGNL